MWTVPCDVGRSPLTIWMRVLLPQPLGPRIETNSCSRIERDIDESAWTNSRPFGYTFVTRSISIIGRSNRRLVRTCSPLGEKFVREQIVHLQSLGRLPEP